MIKLCSKSIANSLPMILKNFIATGTIPDIYKGMILKYCNNNMNKHNTCFLRTCLIKITHLIMINSYRTIICF